MGPPQSRSAYSRLNNLIVNRGKSVVPTCIPSEDSGRTVDKRSLFQPPIDVLSQQLTRDQQRASLTKRLTLEDAVVAVHVAADEALE
jgi:hypothetical protein